MANLGATKTDCIEFDGYRNPSGYGMLSVDNYPTLAHRAVAKLYLPDYSDELYVMHLCNNRSCVNPGHLQMGTQVKNQRYMADLGRGKNQFSSMFDENDAADMASLRALGWTYQRIADAYGVSISTAHNFIKKVS